VPYSNKLLAERLEVKLREAFSRPDLEYAQAVMMRDIPGFDSVNFVMMILALETEFGVELHEDEVDSIYTMGDIFALLRGKVTGG
jgi:acyl carrier protein